jgi:murein DD-endopeptidase MepM/ murein hydrolase activator NlpD
MIALLLACAAPVAPGDSTADTADSGVVEVPRGALQFRFPLLETELFEQTVGVDHDPVEYDPASIQGVICTSYDGRSFPWCYDGHDGSDFLLVGGFDTMDAGSATILAAAPGTVVETDDGHYDRCHATFDGIDCDGNDGQANYVIVEHEGGWRTKYWHMMSGSVAVAVGDVVACGDTLGTVGSSGYSSMPHLHFELESPEGTVVDPYAGAWSQPETWWVEQGEPEGLPGDACAQ